MSAMTLDDVTGAAHVAGLSAPDADALIDHLARLGTSAHRRPSAA